MARLQDDDAVRADMLKLAAVVKEIRHEYPRMELGQLHVYLLTLTQPGINMADLLAPSNLSKAAISRNVRALSAKSYLADDEGDQREGLDLVVQMDDARDSRAKIVAPTKRGRALAERLSNLLRNKD